MSPQINTGTKGMSRSVAYAILMGCLVVSVIVGLSPYRPAFASAGVPSTPNLRHGNSGNHRQLKNELKEEREGEAMSHMAAKRKFSGHSLAANGNAAWAMAKPENRDAGEDGMWGLKPYLRSIDNEFDMLDQSLMGSYSYDFGDSMSYEF